MKFPEYKQIVNLIPGGCPQFLDFRLDADSMKREMRSFREETADKSQGGLYEHYLRCLVEDDPEERPGELVDMRESRGTRPAGSPRPKSFASDYEVSLQESLECFKGEWMPLPFLLQLLPLPELLSLWNGRFFSQYPLSLGTLDPAFSLPGGMCLVQSGLLAAGVVLLTAALHHHSPGE